MANDKTHNPAKAQQAQAHRAHEVAELHQQQRRMPKRERGERAVLTLGKAIPLLALLLLIQIPAWSQSGTPASPKLVYQGKNFTLASRVGEEHCSKGIVVGQTTFASNVRIPEEEEYLSLFLTTLMPAVEQYCGGHVKYFHTFHIFDGYTPRQSQIGEVGTANIKLNESSGEWRIDLRGFHSIAEKESFEREKEESARPRVPYEDLPAKTPEQEALLEELLQLGLEKWRLELSEETYRSSVDVFAQLCEKAHLRGCSRLDWAIDQARANCRGDTKKGLRKPWACGLWGYAMKKVPLRTFKHPEVLFPAGSGGRNNKPLIRELYQNACNAGNDYYCTDPFKVPGLAATRIAEAMSWLSTSASPFRKAPLRKSQKRHG